MLEKGEVAKTWAVPKTPKSGMGQRQQGGGGHALQLCRPLCVSETVIMDANKAPSSPSPSLFLKEPLSFPPISFHFLPCCFLTLILASVSGPHVCGPHGALIESACLNHSKTKDRVAKTRHCWQPLHCAHLSSLSLFLAWLLHSFFVGFGARNETAQEPPTCAW